MSLHFSFSLSFQISQPVLMSEPFVRCRFMSILQFFSLLLIVFLLNARVILAFAMHAEFQSAKILISLKYFRRLQDLLTRIMWNFDPLFSKMTLSPYRRKIKTCRWWGNVVPWTRLLRKMQTGNPFASRPMTHRRCSSHLCSATSMKAACWCPERRKRNSLPSWGFLADIESTSRGIAREIYVELQLLQSHLPRSVLQIIFPGDRPLHKIHRTMSVLSGLSLSRNRRLLIFYDNALFLLHYRTISRSIQRLIGRPRVINFKKFCVGLSRHAIFMHLFLFVILLPIKIY